MTTKQQNSTLERKAGGYPGEWTGRFIWDYQGEWPDPELPFHYFTRFRRTFELDEIPESAVIHVAVADKYILYVNGEYVGRGPARSVGPQWTTYDTLDISDKLVKGKNVIAVLAYYYGNENGFSVDQCPGFFAQIEMRQSDGKEQIIGTDGTWKTKPLNGYRQDVELVTRFEGSLTEVYDARENNPDWMNVDYDDDCWRAAFLLNPFCNRSSCWDYLEPRMTPNLRERRIKPEKVVKTGEARELPQSQRALVLKDVQVAERLSVEHHFPLELATLENSGNLLHGNAAALFQSSQFKESQGDDQAKGLRDPFVILDFGRSIYGRPFIEFDAPEGAVVELTWTCNLTGDRVMPLDTVTQGRRNAASYTAREGQQTWQMFEGNCFRYLQVVFRNAPMLNYPGGPIRFEAAQKKNARPIKVNAIDVVAFEYPVEQKGSFECSDSTLSQLWQTGADAVYQHMEDTFVIDAERERMLYSMFRETLHSHWIIRALYGDLSITENHFRQTSRMQLPNGTIPGYLHGKPPAGFPAFKEKLPIMSKNWHWLNNYMSTFAHAVADQYRFNGKFEFLEEHYPVLCKHAEWCLNHQNMDGLLYNTPGWNWFDWIDNETDGANFESNAAYYKMLREMTQMAGVLGYERDEKKWQERADKVLQSLRSLHWDEDAGLFADSVIDGKQSDLFTETANGMALMYGIATEEQAKRILEKLTDLGTETQESTKKYGNPYIRRQFKNSDVKMSCASPLYIYDTIRGLADAGEEDYALKYLSERFKVMMAGDSPSFAESWPDPQGGMSRVCGSSLHTGGGGVVWFLSTEVLGISYTEPAFGRCRIKPLCGHLSWTKGAMPTPKGNIEVSWEKKDGGFTLSANIPESMETEVVLPVNKEEANELAHNGQKCPTTELSTIEDKKSLLR